MKRKLTVIFVAFFAVALFASRGNAEGVRPWEKYGITQMEWKLVNDSGITIDKLEEILRDGIGVREYAEKPWLQLKLSERGWLKKRRSGLTAEDIALDEDKETEKSNTDNKNTFKSETSGIRDTAIRHQLLSLAVPGIEQYREGEKTKGGIMGGIGAVAIIGTIALSAKQADFNATPLLLYVVDMIWSFVDYKFTCSKREKE